MAYADGVHCHCRSWRRLHTLRLSGEPSQPLCLLPHLSPLPSTLTSLALDFFVAADDTSLEALGCMTQLTALQLRLADGPHRVQSLGQLTQLRQLHLCAWVEDVGDAWLPSSLHALTIGANERGYCGDAWADALRSCGQLRDLTLQEWNAEDMVDVVLDLSHCTQLTRLAGDVTGPATCGGLPPSLQQLQLLDSDSGRKGLFSGMPPCVVSEGLPGGLVACTDLEVLHVECCGTLPPLPKLHSACLGVWVDNSDPGGLGLVHSVLSSISATVTSVEFATWNCYGVSIESLRHCSELRELCLNGTRGTFMLDVEHLRPLTSLTKLVLYDCDAIDGSLSRCGFTTSHDDQLGSLPLQQLHVPWRMWERMKGSVAQGCKVFAL